MKKFIFFILLMFSFGASALTMEQLEVLLKQKGIEVRDLNSRNMTIYMGENTGHLPFSKVQILVTENEAILKKEIDSADLSGQNLGSMNSVRYNGQYILKQDVKAAIAISK